MKDIEMKVGTALAAASLLAATPAWSQAVAQNSNDAVLQRIEALTRELEQLKAEVKANEAKARKATEEVKALATKPVVRPSGKPAEMEIARRATEELADASKPGGIALYRSAKADLRFYGRIDAGAEKLVGKLADGNDARAVRISNGMVTPHFGLLGNGDLGRGLQGSFNLEGSYASDNGTSGIGGRLFGRQAWVGVSSAFGTVRFGRQYTMVRMGWEDANPYGTGNQGLRLLDPRISNPRADNAVSYIAHWGPITAGANYSAGWDAVNGNSSNSGPANNAGANCPGETPDAETKCREWSLAAKYTGSSWGVATAYEQLRGGTSTTFGGLVAPNKTDTRHVVSGYVKLKGVKLTAGWIRRDNQGNATTPKSDLAWVQGIFPVTGPFFVDGLVSELKYKDSSDKAVLTNLRGRYVVTDDMTLYLTAAHMKNSGKLALPATASTPAPTPLAGGTQTSYIAGILFKF